MMVMDAPTWKRMTIENRCTFSKDVLVLKHFEILD